MGTRSNTLIVDQGDTLVRMYRQMDGYIEGGHGEDLVEAFGRTKVGNGIPLGGVPDKYANGMDCLAAQVVNHFKDGAGGIYLMKPCTERELFRWDWHEDYTYVLYEEDSTVYVRAYSWRDLVYDGPLFELLSYNDEPTEQTQHDDDVGVAPEDAVPPIDMEPPRTSGPDPALLDLLHAFNKVKRS